MSDIKNIKDIDLNSIDLKHFLDEINNIIMDKNKKSKSDCINYLFSRFKTVSMKDFDNLPDIDLMLSKTGKFSSSEDDVQKMLKWVVIKSKLQELKNISN